MGHSKSKNDLDHPSHLSVLAKAFASGPGLSCSGARLDTVFVFLDATEWCFLLLEVRRVASTNCSIFGRFCFNSDHLPVVVPIPSRAREAKNEEYCK